MGPNTGDLNEQGQRMSGVVASLYLFYNDCYVNFLGYRVIFSDFRYWQRDRKQRPEYLKPDEIVERGRKFNNI